MRVLHTLAMVSGRPRSGRGAATLRSAMMAVGEVLVRGLNRVNLMSSKLQRARLADSMAGVGASPQLNV